MKVCKFGGSSLADAAQLNKVIDIVLADPSRRIVVVSAPGKRHSGDVKVTDLLIALADAALKGGDVDAPRGEVVARYAEMAENQYLYPDCNENKTPKHFGTASVSGAKCMTDVDSRKRNKKSIWFASCYDSVKHRV